MLVSIQEALHSLRNNIAPIERVEAVPIAQAFRRVLAQDVFSPIDMPPFRQSAVDGYALCLHESPSYRVIDEMKAGDAHDAPLMPGEAVRIFTGAAVPAHAHAVIMQEHTAKEGKAIVCQRTPKKGDNIRPLGEQMAAGALALPKGTLLTPGGTGFLAGLGVAQVPVYEVPSIGILATGSELIAPGQPLARGQIYESNALMLAHALQSKGYTAHSVQQVPDSYEATKKLLEQAIESSDLVLVSGGISVGDYDFVGKALADLGVETIFYKVAQKPGKPLFFGRKGKAHLLALPGNPAAALTCFYVYAWLALDLIAHRAPAGPRWEKRQLAHGYTVKGDRDVLLKAKTEGNTVSIFGGQSSAMLHTFASANALVYLPKEAGELAQGTAVDAILLWSGQ